MSRYFIALLSVIMLIVVMLNVIIVCVVAHKCHKHFRAIKSWHHMPKRLLYTLLKARTFFTVVSYDRKKLITVAPGGTLQAYFLWHLSSTAPRLLVENR